MQKVALIGAGNFGMAISHIFEGEKDVQAVLWDIDASKIPGQVSLEDTVKSADIVFLSVSSWALREAAVSVLPYIREDAVVISPTKGIEQKTLQTSEEVLRDSLSGRGHVALLHGPMLAAEIMQGLPAFAVCASKHVEDYEIIKSLFENTLLGCEYSEDIHGIALAGVLKNIYSIGLGMSEAMRLGSNFRGWFVRVALAEMEHIITSLGGNAETARTSAGLGDLIATGFSPYSRNCQVGHEIVQSGECITVSEGAGSLPHMMKLLEKHAVAAPLCSGLSRIVQGEISVSELDRIVSLYIR